MNIRVGELSGSDATNALHDTLKRFNKQSQEQTAQMVMLTKVIVGLTVVTLIGVLVQIYLAVIAVPVASVSQAKSDASISASELKVGQLYRYAGGGKFEAQKVIEWKDLK